MARPRICFDSKTGKFVPDQVWQIECGVFVGVEASFAQTPIYKHRDVHTCSVDKRHVTGSEVLEIGLDLAGGDTLSDFIISSDLSLPLITDRFLQRLNQSGLTGFAARPIVKIVQNQTRVKDPKVYYLDFTGSCGHLSHRYSVQGATNRCLHCDKAVMICKACGFTNFSKCYVCDKWTVYWPVNPDFSHPNGFVLEDGPEIPIVEAKQWDGSDFFKGSWGPFVSKRAKDWLESTHSYPVRFKPALLNIEGVEDKFKAK